MVKKCRRFTMGWACA